MKKAFTLMEIIISVAIITTVIVASISLISSSVSAIRSNQNKIIAVHLAQEGIEIVKNIRDTNWILFKRGELNWRDGLDEGDYMVQYNETQLSVFDDVPLKINQDNIYQYDNGSNTFFHRKISITHIANEQIKIIAKITWQEKGKNKSIELEDRLYNWLK